MNCNLSLFENTEVFLSKFEVLKLDISNDSKEIHP